ncbi:bacterial transcriptional activator domain-containing protein [Parafrankia sp. EUN1f]|uniref:bacterial transcriptional activator domain-containing protein n=1 Tax=Parafrankia sp. EUN1f TaxID=102897 RepID=UPI0001C451FE|nr:bacterial transcriptional activator domain-containing protein [Parafrankia sp. EUN1f]EFC82841.1 transcriptional regulator, SARP family [Parafrankia sp. EUN1f]
MTQPTLRPARQPLAETPPSGGAEILRSIAALAGLVLFLVAVPTFLAVWRGYPLPTSWDPARWWTLTQRGYVHPDVFPNALAVAAWLVWAWLALGIVLEILSLGARRYSGRAEQPGARTATRHGAVSARGADSIPRRGLRAPAPSAVRRATARWVALASIVLGLAFSRPVAASALPAGAGPAVPVTATDSSFQDDGVASVAHGRFSPASNFQPSAQAGAHSHPGPSVLPYWLASAGLLTAAAAVTIDARRRRRDIAAGPRGVPPAPEPAAAALHTAVLAHADIGRLSRLDQAMHALAAAHVAGAERAEIGTSRGAVRHMHMSGAGPVPLVVLVRPDGTIDVRLRDPVPDPPVPWVADAGGKGWLLRPESRLPMVNDLVPPCPLLVQLGTQPDGGEVHVDLEALGVLALDPGATGAAGLRSLARAILATLALSPLAVAPNIVTIGFDPLGLLKDDRVETAADLPEVVRTVLSAVTSIGNDLDRAGQRSTFAARAHATTENWDPTAALVLPTAGDTDIRTVASLAHLIGTGGRGLALITQAHHAIDPPWSLTFDGLGPDNQPRWCLDPLGITITPVGMAAEELHDLIHLLDDIDQPATPPPATGPDAAGAPAVHPEPSARSAPFVEPDWSVMIRLLGPFDAVGRDGRRPPHDLARERTLEVLAWLATHRGRTRTDLESALWPAGAQVRSINNQLGRARSLLVSLAGEQARQWLPTRRTTITLNPAVTTDLDLLHARLEHAQRQQADPDSAIRTLADGLELVRGTPARAPWLEAELGSVLTTTVIRAALLLADLHLDRGDTDAVLNVTQRGLAVLPTHPGLFALRLRAYARAGDRAALRAEYQAYLRAEHADPFWDGDTDRDLEILWQHLTRGT